MWCTARTDGGYFGARRALSARWTGAALGVVLSLTSAACGDGGEAAARGGSGAPAPPPLSAEINQQRRDQVSQRLQVALRNDGTEKVLVESMQARLPGFSGPGPVATEAPIPPGQVVNLPWSYGDVACPVEPGASGGARVTLRVRTDGQAASRPVTVAADDPRGLLRGIAERTCTGERLIREVDLRFADAWRLERSPTGDVLHGTLLASLRTDEPRNVTDVAGAIMYGLRYDDSAAARPSPLAALTRGEPRASIPVLAYAARCDGHTIGEIKKPYEFPVWLGAPGDEPFAVTPAVGEATKRALRKVCAF
jgi:hypothetical protein